MPLRIAIYDPAGVRENVALGKSTYQSSSEGAAFSGRAVDGHVAYFPDRCTSAHAGPDMTLWWLVDLGDNYTISDIEITAGIENGTCTSPQSPVTATPRYGYAPLRPRCIPDVTWGKPQRAPLPQSAPPLL